MRVQKQRIHAALGLFGFAALVAGFESLPLAMPYLSQQRQWINAARAKIRGASFIGEAGVILQSRANNCGAACLKMILATHGIERSLASLTRDLRTAPRGTSMRNLRLVAGMLGLPARSWSLRTSDLARVPFPAIAFINGDHFVVVRRFVAPGILEVDDPALGRLHWPVRSFQKAWSGDTLIFDSTWIPL